MLYLLALLAVGNAQWSVTCPKSASDQACCNMIAASLIGKPSWPCINDGSDGPGAGTAQFDACFKCAGVNKVMLRPFLAQRTCMLGTNINAYCEAVPVQGAGPAPVVPTPTKATPKPGTQKPAGTPAAVDGPGGTRTACNQHLVDTCCQWGGNVAGSAGYTKALGCSHCLANGMNTGLRQHFSPPALCGASDLTFFCSNPDWDHQMNAAKPGTFTAGTQADCDKRYQGKDPSKKPPVSITAGLIKPVGPPAAKKCLGQKANKCPAHCVVTNKICVDLNGACEQGSVSMNKLPSKNAGKVCKQIKGCAYNNQLSTCAKAAPAPTPTPGGNTGGGGSCTGLDKKACKKNKANCEYKQKKCQVKAAAPAPGTPCNQINGQAYCKAAGCQYKKKKCNDMPVTPKPGDDCSIVTDKKTCKKTSGCGFAKGKCTGTVGGGGAGPAPAANCKSFTVKQDCVGGGCKWNAKKSSCK